MMLRLLFVNRTAARSEALPAELEARPDIAIDYASSVDEALAEAKKCDMVLVSAALPDRGALDVVRAVKQADPTARILVMDLAGSHQPVSDYLEAGAAGWML